MTEASVPKFKKQEFDQPTMEKLQEAAKPLIKYLAENYHPHVMCVVDATTAQVFEGQARVTVEEFLRD